MSVDPWSHALVEQNHRWLHAWFLAVTGDPHTAEDLTQEVFAEALRSRERFDPERSFGAWLRGIARNLLLAYFRRRNSDLLVCDPALLDLLDDEAAQAEADYGGDLVDSQRRDRLAHCLRRLGERARRLVLERYQHGRSSKAIAALLAMRRGAVDMALCRARQQLARCLDDSELGR